MLGHVPDEDLPDLYRAAAAFALPSLHEGFGIPVLEAMACGTPVLAASVYALPEVCGTAAELVDPYRPAEIAAGLAADPGRHRPCGRAATGRPPARRRVHVASLGGEASRRLRGCAGAARRAQRRPPARGVAQRGYAEAPFRDDHPGQQAQEQAARTVHLAQSHVHPRQAGEQEEMDRHAREDALVARLRVARARTAPCRRPGAGARLAPARTCRDTPRAARRTVGRTPGSPTRQEVGCEEPVLAAECGRPSAQAGPAARRGRTTEACAPDAATLLPATASRPAAARPRTMRCDRRDHVRSRSPSRRTPPWHARHRDASLPRPAHRRRGRRHAHAWTHPSRGCVRSQPILRPGPVVITFAPRARATEAVSSVDPSSTTNSSSSGQSSACRRCRLMPIVRPAFRAGTTTLIALLIGGGASADRWTSSDCL